MRKKKKKSLNHFETKRDSKRYSKRNKKIVRLFAKKKIEHQKKIREITLQQKGL